ncbi:MAG: ABC transporter permease [Bacteroidota bacterium]
MIKVILGSFLLSLQNIRSRFFHTILSVLGIVIGVAALVSILSLIDGMEKFAKDQITQTTSLQAIIIRTEPYKTINNVRIERDSFNYISYERFVALENTLTLPVKKTFRVSFPAEIEVATKAVSMGAQIKGMNTTLHSQLKIRQGINISDEDIINRNQLALVNQVYETELKNKNINNPLENGIVIKGKEYKVIGIWEDEKSGSPEIIIPISTISDVELKKNLPACIVEAKNIEDIKVLKSQINSWIEKNFSSDRSDISVVTNDFRIDQAEKGFLLFRIIMGLIVGISVVVGGIGVMNVLLISVTDRTSEIGIRKAVGANKKAILYQFLTESITISVFGSLLGLIVGVLFTIAAIPIVKALTKIPFQAEYTLNTFLVVSFIAILVGIVFGTYPAIRAARLDPVEAIRKE